MTRVCEVMTRDVRTLAPTETLMKAAQTMDEPDVGVEDAARTMGGHLPGGAMNAVRGRRSAP
jgi:CBS domain-containing protein